MKNIRLIFKSFGLGAIFAFIWVQAVSASALDTIIKGFSTTGKTAGYTVTGEGRPGVEFVPAWIKYMNGMLMLMGALFMINIIYAGWLWFSAHGNEEQVNKSKSLMINAFIGLAVIIGALIIVEVVFYVLGQTVKTS